MVAADNGGEAGRFGGTRSRLVTKGEEAAIKVSINTVALLPGGGAISI